MHQRVPCKKKRETFQFKQDIMWYPLSKWDTLLRMSLDTDEAANGLIQVIQVFLLVGFLCSFDFVFQGKVGLGRSNVDLPLKGFPLYS